MSRRRRGLREALIKAIGVDHGLAWRAELAESYAASASARSAAADRTGAIEDYGAAIAHLKVLASSSKVKKQLHDAAGAMSDYGAAIDCGEEFAELAGADFRPEWRHGLRYST